MFYLFCLKILKLNIKSVCFILLCVKIKEAKALCDRKLTTARRRLGAALLFVLLLEQQIDEGFGALQVCFTFC